MSNFEEKLDQRLAAYRALVLKAHQDAAFRERLKDDPATVIKEDFGVNWPEGIALDVVEESVDRCVLVLPALFPMAVANDELSDDDLELVAAGIAPPGNQHKTSQLATATNAFVSYVVVEVPVK